jgi:hypothetical protein
VIVIAITTIEGAEVSDNASDYVGHCNSDSTDDSVVPVLVIMMVIVTIEVSGIEAEIVTVMVIAIVIVVVIVL